MHPPPWRERAFRKYFLSVRISRLYVFVMRGALCPIRQFREPRGPSALAPVVWQPTSVTDARSSAVRVCLVAPPPPRGGRWMCREVCVRISSVYVFLDCTYLLSVRISYLECVQIIP